ncbi:hypothetical protein C8J56DRAFT_1041201 [Mycena floridula]|nr:hypothetical protein C8J56DRAFT_1041201 [Mycena floridula]
MASFEFKPTIKNASVTALYTGGLGLCISTLQNALGQHSQGALGVLTRTGGTVGSFGATFAFTHSFVANQRQKDDHWNYTSGACAAGFLAGIRVRSIPAAVAGCTLFGAASGAYDYLGALAGSGPPQRKKFFKEDAVQ